jgi:hypothetical protein
MSTTPLNVSKQPCHRPDMHVGADIMSGRRMTNAATATPRTARLSSAIRRARPRGSDRDAW